MRNLAADTPLLVRPEWRRLVEEHHDVLVVGGGIHGAGAARDAALRGLRTAVIERGDWASGTSSRSSKLMHGGLRYLRQGALGLVREALAERERHLRLAPASVHPLRFRVPPPAPGAPPGWQIRAGIAVYDLLSGRLLASRFHDREPSYLDASLNDARFCLEVVFDARRHGALAVSHVEWLEWVRRGDRILGARVRDRFTGEEGLVSAGAFVNAAGPWADVLAASREAGALRLTRGTHIVLDRAPDGDARLFFSPRDARPVFLLPFEHGTSLLTTTDLDEPGPSREPIPREEEIRYLREAFVAQFPEWAHWRPLGVQCGLRPLLAGDGAPASLSREERILTDPSGSLISVLGGKYTTYRAVAERVVDGVERALGRPPAGHPTRDQAIPPLSAPADLAERIRRAFAEEDAVRLEDVFLRRTTLGYRGTVDRSLLDLAVKLWRLRWGKGDAAAAREREAFLDLQARRSAPLAAWKP